jgi:hypothetical protein
VAVANAVSFLEQIESADGTDTAVIHCEKCRHAGTDTAVPEVLLPLHDLIVHSEKGLEYSITFSRLLAVSLMG